MPNGVARSVTPRWRAGSSCGAEGRPPGALEKTDRRAGLSRTAAPFAIVLGTIADDPGEHAPPAAARRIAGSGEVVPRTTAKGVRERSSNGPARRSVFSSAPGGRPSARSSSRPSRGVTLRATPFQTTSRSFDASTGGPGRELGRGDVPSVEPDAAGRSPRPPRPGSPGAARRGSCAPSRRRRLEVGRAYAHLPRVGSRRYCRNHSLIPGWPSCPRGRGRAARGSARRSPSAGASGRPSASTRRSPTCPRRRGRRGSAGQQGLGLGPGAAPLVEEPLGRASACASTASARLGAVVGAAEDGRDRREDLGVARAHLPRAPAAHRVAHQVDAVLVDR